MYKLFLIIESDLISIFWRIVCLKSVFVQYVTVMRGNCLFYNVIQLRIEDSAWHSCTLSIPPSWKGFIPKLPPTPLKIHFFKCLGRRGPPTCQEIPILSVKEYGYFLELHIHSHSDSNFLDNSVQEGKFSSLRLTQVKFHLLSNM